MGMQGIDWSVGWLTNEQNIKNNNYKQGRTIWYNYLVSALVITWAIRSATLEVLRLTNHLGMLPYNILAQSRPAKRNVSATRNDRQAAACTRHTIGSNCTMYDTSVSLSPTGLKMYEQLDTLARTAFEGGHESCSTE
jgi:hypothetical protein